MFDSPLAGSDLPPPDLTETEARALTLAGQIRETFAELCARAEADPAQEMALLKSHHECTALAQRVMLVLTWLMLYRGLAEGVFDTQDREVVTFNFEARIREMLPLEPSPASLPPSLREISERTRALFRQIHALGHGGFQPEVVH